MWPILFSWGGFELRSAALFEGLAALSAMLYLRSQRESLGLSLESFWELVLALMAGVFVGGIGAYVLLYGSGPVENLNVLLRGRVPGGSFFGVVGGAVAGGYLVCRFRGLPFAPVADALGAGASLGLLFMRLGCILNGCCHGHPAAGWGIAFRNPACRVPRELLGVPLYPVQLYEAAGALLIFLWVHLVVLPRIRGGALKPGAGFFLFAGLYGVLRFAGDFWRASDPGLVTAAGLGTAQWLGLLCAVAAGVFWLKRRP
jgi:phosphatidylglycerol:prolipoprotein diacylglycerol transferase